MTPEPWPGHTRAMNLRGAFEAGESAFGMASLRPGFGLTPDDDRLLALGYPHMIVPVEAKVAWNKFSTAKDLLRKYPLESEFPCELIPWLAQNWNNVARADLRERTPATPPGDVVVDTDEALGQPTSVGAHMLLYALEAIHGSSAVAQSAVQTVEAWGDEEWGRRPGNVDLVRGLHYVLLRCETTVRNEFHKRLERVFDAKKALAFPNGTFHRGVAALHLAIHGRAGVERSGYRPNKADLGVWDLPFAHDDPAFVREIAMSRLANAVANDRTKVDVRLAFLGGDGVAAAMCGDLKWLHKDGRKRFVVQVGRLSGDLVAAAMRALAELPGAKKEARAWLKGQNG